VFPRRLRPGQQYTATELSEMARTVASLDRASGAGNITLSREAGGFVVRDDSTPPIFAKITGAPTGAKYPWSEVSANEDGTFGVAGSEYGRFGTAAASPAVELGGRTDVAVNSIVVLFPLASGAGWGFSAGTTPGNWSSSASGILTTTSQTGAGLKIGVVGTDGTPPGWTAYATTTEITGSPTGTGSWIPYNAQWMDGTLGSSGFAATLYKGTVLGIDQVYTVINSYSAYYTLSAPALSLCRNGAAAGIILAGTPTLSGLESSFAVHRGGVLKVGTTTTVSGLSFAGGLYISGSLSVSAGSVSGLAAIATSGDLADLGGLGTNVATFLGTPSSANLAAAVTDETGSGALVFASGPTLSNPVVGTQSAGDNSTKAASTAYVDGAISTAVAGTTVSASYNSGTKDLTITVNGVSYTVNLT